MIKGFLENYHIQTIAPQKIKEAVIAFTVLGLIWMMIIFLGYFWLKIKLWKRLDFWLVLGTMIILVVVKIFFLRYLNSYFFDRIPVYALFSPKINFLWAIPLILGLFFLWLGLYQRFFQISAAKFLTILILFFIVFSISIALTRDGAYGLYETFMHSKLDYHGDARKITNVGDFLKNYSELAPTLSQHGTIHPPGYALLHYLFIKLFGDNLLFLALSIIFLGALTIIPIYFLARKFDAENARIATMLCVFAPAYVIFTATCVDIVFFLVVSLLFLSIFYSRNYWGWARSGAILALAIMFHFMSPLFGIIAVAYSYLKNRNFKKTALEMLIFGSMPIFIFLLMRITVGYDIIKNFFVALKLSDLQFIKLGVKTNYASPGYYVLYQLMSIIPFLIYLSWPVILNYIKEIRGRAHAILSDPQKILVVLGWVFLPVLLFAGIFMAETERLWIFLVPFFVLPAAKKIMSDEDRSAVFVLLFLQIITTQIVFFTYW
jgi:hypothetical protein